MTYVLGALAGIAWGAVTVFINILLTKNALKKNNPAAAATLGIQRTATDLAALGVIFLLRDILPFSVEAMMIATAIIVSVGTVIFSFRMAKKMK